MPSPVVHVCFVCGEVSSQRCGACHVMDYCSRDHQRLHWHNGHKAECGKFYQREGQLVAAKDIPPGTEIFRDEPIFKTPLINAIYVCVECHKQLDLQDEQDMFKCSKCEWPLCSETCKKSSHHLKECEILQEISSESPNCYSKISALRYLMLDEESKSKLAYTNFRKANLVPIKVTENSLEFSEKDINEALNLVTANSSKIIKTGYKSQGLYFKHLKLAHNCLPNCKQVYFDDTCLVVSTVPILKGDIISCSFVKTLIGTIERKEYLFTNKGIECVCDRCSDATELGTFAGSVYCHNCSQDEKTSCMENGIPKMLSTDPLKLTAPWVCEYCSRSIPSKSMKFGNITIHEEIKRLNRTCPKALEEFLVKYENILHSTNAHAIRIKFELTQLYGNVSGYLFSEMDLKTIDNIVFMCQELLDVAEKLDPGWSKFRGCVLMTLQAAMVVQTKLMFNKNIITKVDTTSTLSECMILLQEAVQILSTEPKLKNNLSAKLQALSAEIDFD